MRGCCRKQKKNKKTKNMAITSVIFCLVSAEFSVLLPGVTHSPCKTENHLICILKPISVAWVTRIRGERWDLYLTFPSNASVGLTFRRCLKLCIKKSLLGCTHCKMSTSFRLISLVSRCRLIIAVPFLGGVFCRFLKLSVDPKWLV